MARRYNVPVAQDQTPRPLPELWLLSDARNDAALDRALAQLPEQSGFIFRHYHLDPAQRRARFQQLQEIARKRRHLVVISGSPVLALKWGAAGVYGPAEAMPHSGDLIKLVTAHNAKDIVSADRAGADAILLSPVFATASHPGAKPLGPVRFRLLAQKAKAPVIALGGMNRDTAKRLGWARWAAIDGLS